MAVYSISYDLNKEGQNYKDLIAEIKSFNGYCKVMDSYWFVSSNNDAQIVYSKLAKLYSFTIKGNSIRCAHTSNTRPFKIP